MSQNKLGRYDIIRVLGRGAMGLVYEARDPNLNRRVAIKTIKVENLSEEAAAEYEARFKTEAHSAARLQHPNIVSVYDSDRHGDMAFLVMEFIQGEDLKHHLDGGKRYSLEQSLAMVRELLSALEYAHRQSIVHRDVKPANLLIEADGRLKLTDFGVARIQDSGEATRTQGSMVGTLKYMSPEQVQGQPIDARADLFAVGIVLYQLLTGKRPFDGDTDFTIIQQIVNHTPVAPSSINNLLPPAIDAVVARALTKNRDQRFATAQEFAQALQEASGQASDPTVVPPVSQPGRRAGNATDTGLQRSRAGGSTVKMSSSGTDSGSTVTQELELVYWKDIKDSEDIEDLEGFLDRFPSGIYADLARRRLKKLGGAATEDSGADSVPIESEWTRLQNTLPSAPTRAAGVAVSGDVLDEEASLTVLRSISPQTSSAAQVPPAAAQAPEAAARASTAPSGRSRNTGFVFAGVAVLVLVSVVFKFFFGGTDPVEAAPAAAALPAALAGAASPNPAGSPMAPSAAVSATTAPVSPAAVAKQVARPVVNSAAAATDKPASGVKPAIAETLVPTPGPAPSERAGTRVPSNPRQACENRILLGFQICMNEQCAKSAYTSHPVCIERRATEKLRRESQEMRN